MTNCNNCGAVLKSESCEYCGTVYGKAEKTTACWTADLYDVICKDFGASFILNNPPENAVVIGSEQ